MKKFVFEQDTNNVNICLNVKITFFPGNIWRSTLKMQLMFSSLQNIRHLWQLKIADTIQRCLNYTPPLSEEFCFTK